MKIVLHLGFHKTASTMLQDMLERAKTDLRAQGVLDLRSHLDERAAFRDIRWGFISLANNLKDRKIPGLIQKTRDLIARADATGVDRLILSDENFMGHPPSFHIASSGHAWFYRFAESIAEIWHRITDGYETEIVFVIRQQESLYLSHYMDGLRWLRYDMSPDDFAERLFVTNKDRLHFSRIIAPWQRHYGEGSVHSFRFETLVARPQDFLDRFSGVVGVDPGTLVMPERKVNAAFSGYQAAMARRLHHDVKAGAPVKGARQAVLSARPVTDEDRQIARPGFSAPMLDRIRTAFVDDLSYQG